MSRDENRFLDTSAEQWMFLWISYSCGIAPIHVYMLLSHLDSDFMLLALNL